MLHNREYYVRRTFTNLLVHLYPSIIFGMIRKVTLIDINLPKLGFTNRLNFVKAIMKNTRELRDFFPFYPGLMSSAFFALRSCIF